MSLCCLWKMYSFQCSTFILINTRSQSRIFLKKIYILFFGFFSLLYFYLVFNRLQRRSVHSALLSGTNRRSTLKAAPLGEPLLLLHLLKWINKPARCGDVEQENHLICAVSILCFKDAVLLESRELVDDHQCQSLTHSVAFLYLQEVIACWVCVF